MNWANYNAVLAMNIIFRLRTLVPLMLLLSIPALAADWNKPATELAKSIAAASGPGTITLAVRNSSSLPKDQVTEIQSSLETQLRASGVRVSGAANANSEVRVTLSENLQGFVWVAEVKQGNETQVEMVTVPRTQAPVILKTRPSITLHKALLFAQAAPILDALVVDSASLNARLFVLDPETITSYVIRGSAWAREQSWNLTRGHPFPRDVRGLLVPNQNRGVDAYLPGTVCEVSPQTIVCRDGDDPWKLGPRAAFFNSARNYFTGALVPASGSAGSPFYSAAWIDRSNYLLALFMGVDGRLHMNDGMNDRTLPPASTGDWGSDIAAVKSGCGVGTQLLVTSAGDDTQSDSLRAFEIPDRDPVQASAPLEFAGPITALWTHDVASAMAITHNLRTGQYEAYSVSITCNQ